MVDSRRLSSFILLAAAVLCGAGALGWLQMRTPHLVDRDSYYHARLAQLLPERGLSREFPWAQESVWRDRFSDKDFLFHVVLAPFCRGENAAAGAKWAAWLCGCAALMALAWVLHGSGFRAPALWVLLIPALGNHFLFRMVEVRSHVLSVALLLLGLLALLKDRRRWAFVVGFVYSWTYAAPHLFVVFAAIDALARSAAERKWTWGGLPAAAAGVAAGLVIHPYFPYDLQQWWILNVRIMGRAWFEGGDPALRLGEEFQPISPRSLIVSSTLVFLALAGTFAAAVFRGEALGTRTRRMAAWMLAGFFLYCMSARFIEYFAPLALLAGASAAEDLFTRRRGAIAAMVLALALGARSLDEARRQIEAYPGPDLGGAARWVRWNVPAGETVAHLDWGDFVQLFYFDPSHRYLVGLDPMFMYVRNPERLRLLEDVRAGRRPLDPAELARTFGARVLVTRAARRGPAEAAGLRLLYEDPADGSAVYALAP